MTKKHRFYFFLVKIGLFFQGIIVGRRVYIYSDAYGKYKFISGEIVSLEGCSISKSKFDYSINIEWDEPLQGNDPRYYSYGAYNYKSFKEQVRFSPKYQKREKVLMRRSGDRQLQWREQTLLCTYLKLANQFPEDYIPIMNNNDLSRIKVDL